MRIAYKGIFFLFLLFQLFFANSLFANIKALQDNYKSAYIPSEAELVVDTETDDGDSSVLPDQVETEEVTQEANLDGEEQYNINLSQENADIGAVIIVDKFSAKDDLEAYRKKYLVNTQEVGTARYFAQESIRYRDLENFAKSVSANIVLFKVIDFTGKKDAEYNYYYDIKFLVDRVTQENQVEISASQDIPWKRTSQELENFSAPTSMFQFFDKNKRILVKEQSRIMIEYGLKTQKDFDDFIAKYSPKQELEQVAPAPAPVQEAPAVAEEQQVVEEGVVQDETIQGQDANNGQTQEVAPTNAEIVAQVVENVETATEHDILGLRDFYFTTLEGRWVDIASGNVFDIIALTDYNKEYQGYEKYDDNAPRESLYDFDSAKKSITQYSPASLQEERKYVVYTAYYVGNALEQVKDYNQAYAKSKGEKVRFNYLERAYNKETTWENEDFVLEFNTKSQDGIYLTENKVPMPANFKAFPHRGYIKVELKNGDTRYLLPLQIAEDVNLPLPPQPKEPEYDEDGNLIEDFSSETEEVGPEGYYDPYIYDSRFNSIVFLDKVPFYRTAHIAQGEIKKDFSDSYMHFLIPIVAIFAAITVVL